MQSGTPAISWLVVIPALSTGTTVCTDVRENTCTYPVRTAGIMVAFGTLSGPSMPPSQYSRDEIVSHVMTVLRRLGYDGASLSELSKATGLGKSSLYHHFPNGKDDMVMAVLEHLDEQLRQQLFEPLRSSGAPPRRIQNMVRTLDTFYDHGNEACLLAQLALGSTHTRFREPVRAILAEWISALASVLVDAGFTRAVAARRAEDAVVRIEGALMLAFGMGDTGVFARTLKQLPTALLD